MVVKETKDRDYIGSTALVVGAARSGIAAAEFLLSRGAHVILTDLQSETSLSAPITRLKEPATGNGSLALEMGGHERESFRSCDFVVVSPGVPLSLPYLEESRRAGIPIYGEVELAFQHLNGTIVGITGSNGKTTTTSLVAELLKGTGIRAYAVGNIGIPLISFVSSSTTECVYATELSSFQLESIHDFRPKVAAILNISEDHMDRYEGIVDYIEAKRRIFMNQDLTDFAVLNADDPRTAAMDEGVPSSSVLFSRQTEVGHGTFMRNDLCVYRDDSGESELFAGSEIAIRGSHNVENVLAATAMALLVGAEPRSMRDVVRHFTGVEHRLEWVANIDGVQYFNDSKATNVNATIKSIEAFPQNIHLILGGRDKGADFGALRPLVQKRVEHLILLGEAAEAIRDALADAADITEVGSLNEAVELCYQRALGGDIVLLAPACASFDMFQNYEQRGRVFKEAVTNMMKKG